MRSALGAAGSLEEFKSISEMLKSTYIKYHEGTKAWTADNQTYNLELPPWVCQSYVRASPEDHIKKMKQSIEVFFINHLSFIESFNLINFRHLKIQKLLLNDLDTKMPMVMKLPENE